MSTNTTNYQLIKPDRTDNVLVEDINYNTEIIDQELKKNANSIINLPSTYVLKTDNATETNSGTIRIASTSQVATGTDDTTAITPAKLKQLFVNGVNVSANGYEKLPNGLIRQWGVAVISPIQNGLGSFVETTINFPIVFPNGCLIVNVSGTADSGDDGIEALNSVLYRERYKTIIRSYRIVGSYNGLSGSVCWTAIGY